ncbi:hypothetical protein [Psychrobacter sp. K31L]|uniref:hypothetical protein n=1 Tax=Psychrobacter sp. K31L TaxID=2820758 RepID=UPI001B33738C|nr:hypothetical protein [Psychrobacter sp. K31L]MBP3945155.1 hypothetical protein [Psychrobacter sp. K31L]
MIKFIAANLVIWGGIAFAVLPDAWAIDDANNQAIVDSHKVEISEGKAYTVVEIDGEYLTSNEWQPTTESGYTDEYRASDEYKTVKAANESLKRIKGG